jgi:hypothetical protein
MSTRSLTLRSLEGEFACRCVQAGTADFGGSSRRKASWRSKTLCILDWETVAGCNFPAPFPPQILFWTGRQTCPIRKTPVGAQF